MHYNKHYSSQTTTNNICLRWITNVFILKKSDCSLSGRGANYVQLSLGQTVDGSLISQMANGGKNEAVA